MKVILNTLLIILISIITSNCSTQKHLSFKQKKLYTSQNLSITQISENTFLHVSYKQTNDFGNVPCNGLIVRSNKDVIIFDTPTNDKSSEELIKWINETLQCKIIAVIPTHFHDDCLGGLNAFNKHAIPSYANYKTIELVKENNLVVPKISFRDSLILKVGEANVIIKFFGEGHTKDNVVGYFPGENILFGGCLIKELNASKGYLGDATIKDWSATVENIKKEYPNVKIVVPGHGAYGDIKLLDYTINLFKNP